VFYQNETSFYAKPSLIALCAPSWKITTPPDLSVMGNLKNEHCPDAEENDLRHEGCPVSVRK